MKTDPPTVAVGAEVPEVIRRPDEVDLFAFSASAWLLHRIHYDLPFTTDHDGHPGLLVHGPLQGTWLIQCVQWWLGPTAELVSIAYRHSAPAYAGEELTCSGTVTAVDPEAGTFAVDLRVTKPTPATDTTDTADGERPAEPIVTTSGTATFRLPQSPPAVPA